MSETIFSKIIKREIPADIVYENDKVLAFRDINPQAPVHILIIPKEEIPTVKEIDAVKHGEILAAMHVAANEIAEAEGIAEDGFRLVYNCCKHGGQEVYHIHMHLLGGRQMKWPPG